MTQPLCPMHCDKIREAQVEAKRLLARIEEWENDFFAAKRYNASQVAAIRRASMDVTRSLARMRVIT